MKILFGILWLVQTIGFVYWIDTLEGRLVAHRTLLVYISNKIKLNLEDVFPESNK